MQVLILLGAMGTGMVVLPRRAAAFAGQDGWVVALGLTVLGAGLAFLMLRAAGVRPGASFIGYAGYALSRPAAFLCGGLLWVKLVVSAGLEMRLFLLIARQVLLRETPMFVVGFVMLFVCTYAAVKGVETRARTAEVLVLVWVLPLVFLFVIALVDMDFSNLRPVFTAPPERLLSGIWRLGFVFTGLECLLLVSPYIARGKKAGRAAAGAVGLAGLIITAFTVITLAKFGTGVADEPWPVLRMMDMLNLPGPFIGRQEALLFGFWIVTVFALVNALLFFGGGLLEEMGELGVRSLELGVKKKKQIRFVCTAVTALGAFVVSCLPWGEEEIYRKLDGMYYTGGVFFLLVFPLLVLLGAALRKRGDGCKGNMVGGVKGVLLVLFIITPLFFFTGCWDGVEIEERAFVAAVGVDKADLRYTLSVSDGEGYVKTASAETLTEAMHKLDEEAGTRLYYGQAKAIVLGRDLLGDGALVKNAFAVFAQSADIDRQIKVITAKGNAAEALPGLLGTTEGKTEGAHRFAPDLEELHTQLKQSGSVLVPLQTGGAVALKGYTIVETLTPEELRGFLWCMPEKNKNAVITAQYGEGFVSYEVRKHSVSVVFEPCGTVPRVFIEIKTEGSIIESRGIETVHALRLIEGEIAGEVTATLKKLQSVGSDAYNWREHLRKNQYDLYRECGGRWSSIFPRLEAVTRVTAG
jgi:spore germination protein